MAENKAAIELTTAFKAVHLPLPNKDQLHPYTQEVYVKFLHEVYSEVPTLCSLKEGDLRLFLSDTEYARLTACEQEIQGWLEKCNKNNDEATLKVYPYHSPFNAMWDLKKLIKEVAERKIQREKRLAALEEIDPPFDDVEEHLNKEEQQKFVDSIPGAIDAYLGRDKTAESYMPNIWLLNSRAWDYRYWTKVIEDRRKEEIQQKQAQIEFDQYLDRLSLAVEKFKEELAKSKKPKFVYPPELEKYEPDSWCELNFPSKQQIQNWAEPKILERLPEILANLTKWELTWQVRVLPHATYEVSGAGVPCLTWYFESDILVTVNLELKKCVIRKRRPGYTVEIQAEGEKVGTLYIGPHNWLTPGSFTTPIALLSLLAKGELEGLGITVTDRSPPFTTFGVEGLEEEVEVSDDFRKFIQDIAKEKPLAQALLDVGVMDADTAKLVEAKANLPLPQLVGAGASAGHSGDNNTDVVVALQALGFKKMEINEAMKAAHFFSAVSVQQKVEAVLKILGA